MKITQFRVQDVFGDSIVKDSSSQDQIVTFKTFFSHNDVTSKFSIRIDLFRPRLQKIENYKLIAPPADKKSLFLYLNSK